MKKIDINYSKQAFPFFIYKRLAGALSPSYFFFQFPYGYGYWMRRIIARWPESVSGEAGSVIAPEIYVDMVARMRQINEPSGIPLQIISSPCEFGVQTPALVPPGTAPNGLEFSAAQFQSAKVLDQYYPYNDNMNLKISGQFSAAVPASPAYVDIMIQGYYVPEKTLNVR